MMAEDENVNGSEQNDLDNDGFNLDDPDSLPWLESDDDFEEEGASPLKLAAMVLGGLLALALVVGGIYWLQKRGERLSGNGALIAAQEGDYKVKPENPEGKKFEGEGDAAFAASEGRKPVATPAPAAADATGRALVQLGAYGSAAQAETGWNQLSKRYSVLSSISYRVTQASVDGRTVFRLNAVTSDSAAANGLCSSLTAAGGSCIVVH